MGKTYDQLDPDERYELYRLHEAGKASAEIGRLMGRHRSMIGRELRLNSLPKGGYKPASAERMVVARRRRPSRIERLSPLRSYVGDRLAIFSPGLGANEHDPKTPAMRRPSQPGSSALHLNLARSTPAYPGSPPRQCKTTAEFFRNECRTSEAGVGLDPLKASQCGVGPFGVCEAGSLADAPLGVGAVDQVMAADGLARGRVPQPLNPNGKPNGGVVAATAIAVEGDLALRVPLHGGEVEVRELAAQDSRSRPNRWRSALAVEKLRPDASGQHPLHGHYAKPRMERFRQPCGDRMEARQVRDRDQIKEAAQSRDIRDVDAPHLISAVDRQPLEQIRTNPVLGMRDAGLRRPVNRLYSNQSHRSANPMTAARDALAAQLPRHPRAAVKRILQEQHVDAAFQRDTRSALCIRAMML